MDSPVYSKVNECMLAITSNNAQLVPMVPCYHLLMYVIK